MHLTVTEGKDLNKKYNCLLTNDSKPFRYKSLGFSEPTFSEPTFSEPTFSEATFLFNVKHLSY